MVKAERQCDNKKNIFLLYKNKMFGLCLPSTIYLVVSGILLLISAIGGIGLMSFFVSLVIILLWTWIINLTCTYAFKWVAWILLAIPLILYIYAAVKR